MALGACALAPAIAAGVRVFSAPLRAPGGEGYKVRLTTLRALPIGGAPLLFQVMVERSDAWTRHPLTAIGAVFLHRLDERNVRAFTAACPHLGCAVEWRGDSKTFFCPCHTSSFAVDGAVIPPSPAARAMDTLDVEIRGDGEVWVVFRNFKAGTSEKIAVA